MEINSLQKVNLIPYDEEYNYAIDNYHLPKEQAIYTSLPVEALKQYGKDNEVLPVVILLEDELVGFFVLHYCPNANLYTDNKNAVIFKSFSIDQRFQGKKIAKQSMDLLPIFTRKMIAGKNEILLTVHHTNIPAISLYKKIGFIDKGIRYLGEFGEELIFHLTI